MDQQQAFIGGGAVKSQDCILPPINPGQVTLSKGRMLLTQLDHPVDGMP